MRALEELLLHPQVTDVIGGGEWGWGTWGR